jgi:hypothetical protein
MFDGSVGKRPNVSLRGRSREEEKTEILRRARREREQRALEREKVTSSVRIQKFWRRR